MRSGRSATAWVAGVAVLAAALVVAACGGGGGGSGPDLPGFLRLGPGAGSSTVMPQTNGVTFVNQESGSESRTNYPWDPPTGVPVPQQNGQYTVPPPSVPTGNPGSQDFIELEFNIPVDANTITSDPPSGNDGIVILDDTGAPVPFSLDTAAFVSPGVAPATLRLFYDTDNDLGTPENFPPGDYLLELTGNLRGIGGVPLCVDQGSENCVNSYLPRLPFTIGTDTASPTVPVVGVSPPPGATDVPINSEIVINFSEAVDLPTLLGGTANLSALDPFISIPYPAMEATCAMMGPPLIPPFTNIGNLYVGYFPPTDPSSGVQDTLPSNLGYVVYMPDPLLNPTQVRIRFTDVSNLDATAMGQNYASNPRKLPIVGPGGGVLQRPPIMPVPGSAQGASGPNDPLTAKVEVLIMSNSFMPASPPLPPAPADSCYMDGGGATDRSGNALEADVTWRFHWAEGPALARNPLAPDATYVLRTQGNTRGLGVVNMADFTSRAGPFDTAAPITYGTSIVGNMSLAPNPLANLAVLGTPLDATLGAWINGGVANATNNITNPPRGNTQTAGVPDSQNGTSPIGLLDVVGFCMQPCPPQQPLGNYLYVVDGDDEAVKVFSSYDFTLITTLTNIPSPRGLAMAPNLEFLYISNFNEGTLTKVFANPASNSFHTVSNIINVGAGPTAVSVQPSNEDIFVANFSENTYSIIDTGLNQERVRLPAGLGPSEIFVTHRMNGMGLTNAYLAFVTNFFEGTVTVYESDSFSVPENGPEGKEVAKIGGFDGPKFGTWNWQSYITGTNEPGCFVANTLGNEVSELTLFNFTLSPPPGFPGPPGRREFHIKKSYNGFAVPGVNNATPGDAAVDNHSGLYNVFAVGINNNKGIVDPVFTGSGATPSVVLVSFPAAGVVAAFDYGSPTLFTSISVPGADQLVTYYDQ